MKDIIIKIDRLTSQVYLNKKTLGISGENLQGNIIIKFVNEFVEGVAELKIQMPDGTLGSVHLDKINESYVLPIRSSLLSQNGNLYMQLKITESGSEVPIFKSNDFYLEVKKSIETTETMPEQYPTWEEMLNQKIAEVNDAIQQINTLDVDASKEDNIATITITKKDGSTEIVTIKDGEKGDKGDKGEQGLQGNAGQNGIDGKDGEDYVLTQADKQEIANIVLSELPSSEGVEY